MISNDTFVHMHGALTSFFHDTCTYIYIYWTLHEPLAVIVFSFKGK